MSSAEAESAATVGPSSSSASDKGDQGSDIPPIRSPSPESAKCTICLGDLQNKSHSNVCRHLFCFGCLLEWSKVKPECPLCKSPFRSIVHNIRSTSDYDEYVVPANIPHLSIRLATAEDYPTANPYGEHLIQYERERRRRLDDIHEAVVADLERQRYDRYTMSGSYLDRADPRSRVIRYLEVSERPTNFAFLDARLTNPFQAYNEPEYFGTAIDLVNEETYSGASVPGYQSRRRVYDRGQYVLPFHSTLQPGTVFFPSVEYFRTHPSAPTRVSPWLHRELLVLLGLSYSRQQLAVVYDLILSLLQRYDIRSKEFRDMTKAYFGAKIRHFQHEFYHFVLSGMRMTDYDNVASYSQSATSSSHSVSTAPPPVVTLDSDHDDSDDDVVVENVVLAEPSRISTRRRGGQESRRFEEAYGPITLDLPIIPSVLPETVSTPGTSSINTVTVAGAAAAAAALARGGRHNESDWMPWPPNHLRRRHSHRHGHSENVHSLNLSQPSASSNSYYRTTAAPDFSIVPGDEVSVIPPSVAPSSPRFSSTSACPTNVPPGIGLSPTSPNYCLTSPHYETVYSNDWPTSPNYTPTYPTYGSPRAPIDNDLLSPSRITRSRSDRRKRSKAIESDSRTSKRHCTSKNGSNHAGTSSDKNDQSSSYRIRLRSSTRTSHHDEASANSVPTVRSPDNSITELTTGENYTYNSRPLSGSGIGVHIRIVGRNNSSSGRSEGVIPEASTSSADKLDASKLKNQKVLLSPQVVNDVESDEDCVLLGIHPIVKKPPLAVITISSDDEEEENRKRMKAERERSSVEAIERDSFLELFEENMLMSSFDGIGSSTSEGTDIRMSEFTTVSHSFMDSLTPVETLRSNNYPPAPPAHLFQKDNYYVAPEMSYSHVFSDMNCRHPSVITIADTATSLTNSYSQSNSSRTTQLNPTYPTFVSGMKRHSYHARPEEPSTSAAISSAPLFACGSSNSNMLSNLKSTEKQKSASSASRSDGTTRKSKQEDVRDSSHAHKKKSKHKKSKKVQSHKKKSKKSKRDRRTSSTYSIGSSGSDISVGSIRSILQMSDSETTAGDSDVTWNESELKVSVKCQHKKNHKDKSVKSCHKTSTRSSCRGKKKSSSKDKKKSKYEKKSRKKARVLDALDSSTDEDNLTLSDWLICKRKKIKSRAIISTSDSSDSEKGNKSYSKKPNSFNSTLASANSANNDQTSRKSAEERPSTSKRAKEMGVSVPTTDFSEIPNFGVDLRTQPQTTVGKMLASSEQSSSVNSSLFVHNARPQKHRWESEDEDNINVGDDKFIFTKSSVGLHHLNSKFNRQDHTDTSNSSVDDPRELGGLPRIEPHDFLHSTLTDVMEAPDFSQPYRSPQVTIHDPANEIILNCDGMSSEDEAGLLNLPYQSVDQMAAAILARSIASTGNNLSSNSNLNSNMGHRSDSTDDLMLDITDDDQGLTGLDLSLGRFDVGNDGSSTPHTAVTASSSSYSQSQRWWSQPNQDWDD